MDRELTALLARRFTFFDLAKNPGTSFFYEGFECGNGWAPIFIELGCKLEKLDLTILEIYRIKEKYWTLMLTIEVVGRDEVLANEYVDWAERQACVVCEACGERKLEGKEEHRCLSVDIEGLVASCKRMIRGSYPCTRK